MSAEAFDQRLRQVLLAVIAEYVETAQPVGSRSISRRHIQGLSPATIRNAMADLEDLGYLTHPHTSAGRVPTDAGYRFYVDTLAERKPLPAREIEQIQLSLSSEDSTDKLMMRTSHLLSSFTRNLAIVVSPPTSYL